MGQDFRDSLVFERDISALRNRIWNNLYSTRDYVLMVTHPSTNRAQSCLTLMIEDKTVLQHSCSFVF